MPRHFWRTGRWHFPACPRTAAGARARRKGGDHAADPGGPPEWIWERTPEVLKWEIITSDRPDGQTLYELPVQCGLEIMRLQFFTAEVRQLASLLCR